MAAREREINVFLKSEDGERSQSTVGLDQQAHISDNYLAVDELEAVEMEGGGRSEK